MGSSNRRIAATFVARPPGPYTRSTCTGTCRAARSFFEIRPVPVVGASLVRHYFARSWPPRALAPGAVAGPSCVHRQAAFPRCLALVSGKSDALETRAGTSSPRRSGLRGCSKHFRMFHGPRTFTAAGHRAATASAATSRTAAPIPGKCCAFDAVAGTGSLFGLQQGHTARPVVCTVPRTRWCGRVTGARSRGPSRAREYVCSAGWATSSRHGIAADHRNALTEISSPIA